MAEKFDRSKYKGATLSKISESVAEGEANSKTAKGGSGDGSGFEKTKYHEIKEGKNWFKIAPAHNPDNSPYVPFSTVTLQVEQDKWEQGEKTDQKEIKGKKIFIATIHSPKDKNGKFIMQKDPVELYLEYLNKKLYEEYPDKADRDKKNAPVRGFRGKDGKWVFGIQPDHKMATWAWNDKYEIGRLDLSKKWFKDMEKLSIDEAAEDEIAIDIFSDLDEGYPVEIDKIKTKTAGVDKTSYSVATDKPRKKESWEDFYERIKVSDKAIEEWLAKKPLEESLVGVYTENDFNMAIEGLTRFDEKNKFGIFDNSNFLDEIEELAKVAETLPKREDKKDADIKEMFPEKSKFDSKKLPSNAEEDLTPIQMKKFIRQYIVDNYDGEKELPSDLTKEEIKEWYLLAKSDEELPFDEYEARGGQEAQAEETKDESSSEDDSDISEEAEESIANLRARRKAQNK